MNKRIEFFKRTYFLLGKNEDKEYWLEAPKWTCGWYWTFGKVLTISDKGVERSKLGRIEDFVSDWWAGSISETSFSESNGRILAEAVHEFEAFQEVARLYYGYSPYQRIHNIVDREKWREINTMIIPEIINKALEAIGTEYRVDAPQLGGEEK